MSAKQTLPQTAAGYIRLVSLSPPGHRLWRLCGRRPAALIAFALLLPAVMMPLIPLSSARAAALRAKAWPCMQRKVPELSPGMVWAGPEIKANDQGWSKDEAVAALVRATTSRRRSVEDGKAMIDAFAAKLKKSDKARRLAQVFTGEFQLINAERRQVMAGIERFARHQQALSKAIKQKIVESEKLGAKRPISKAARKRLDKLDEKLKWDTRIYDERQKSLRYVCEVPVLLEQRLFALGRHIMKFLPQ